MFPTFHRIFKHSTFNLIIYKETIHTRNAKPHDIYQDPQTALDKDIDTCTTVEKM